MKKPRPQIEVLYGDCRDLLKEMSGHSFDACITDPPYRLSSAEFGVSKVSYETAIIAPEYREWMWEVKRLVKPNGHIFVWESVTNLDELLAYGKQIGLPFRGLLIWQVTNRRMAGATGRPLNRYDICAWWVKEPATKWVYNNLKDGYGDIFTSASVRMSRLNPVPGAKPLELMKGMVRHFTNPHDWVLDPFAGSGTTARACLELDRNCLTMEIRKDVLSKYLQSRTLTNIRRFW